MNDIRQDKSARNSDLETVRIRNMSVRLQLFSHMRAASYAKACGLSHSDWLIKVINAGLKSSPALAGGEPLNRREWAKKHGISHGE